MIWPSSNIPVLLFWKTSTTLFFFLPLLESYSKIINPKCTSWIHCRAERKPRVSPIFTLKIGVNHLVLTSINWPFQIPIPTLFKCFKKNSSFQKKKSKLKKFALFGFIPVPQYYTLRIRCLLVLTLKSKIPLTTFNIFCCNSIIYILINSTKVFALGN
jgi:hypothetical protein